jgi:hypothetical protein
MQGSLEEDLAALRKLRDNDASGALNEYFGDGEDPREWKHEGGDVVAVAHGRVAMFFLHGCQKLAALPATIGELGALNDLTLRNCSNLAALPAAIGELRALTELHLDGCSSLAELPDAIGELKALTTLNLRRCASLEKLPDAVAACEGLTVVLPTHLIPGSLDEDFAALRKLRDDDASGAIKENVGDDEDPREWRSGNAVTVEDGRVTKLSLFKCSKLAALPDAIGELRALTYLGLVGCSSLVALPDSVGKLGALTTLRSSSTRCRRR